MVNEITNENNIEQQDCVCEQTDSIIDASGQPISKPLFTDIKYKAPFSGKLLQVAAYLLLIFSHFHLMSVFVQAVQYEDVPDWLSAMLQFSDVIKSTSLPLLLLAAFNTIMNQKP